MQRNGGIPQRWRVGPTLFNRSTLFFPDGQKEWELLATTCVRLSKLVRGRTGKGGGGGGKSWRATDGTCGGRGFWSARQRLLVDAFVGRWRGGAPSD